MNVKVKLTVLEAEALLASAGQMDDDAKDYYSFDRRLAPAHYRAMNKLRAAIQAARR